MRRIYIEAWKWLSHFRHRSVTCSLKKMDGPNPKVILSSYAEESTDEENRLGLGKWRPDWLQYFNSVEWFVSLLSICSLTQGIVIYGLVAVSVQSIEKEFGISSKVSGLILATQHASTFLVVTFVSFFGANRNKPVWIGIGSCVCALGACMFIAPKLLSGAYHPVVRQQSGGVGLCDVNSTSSHSEQPCSDSTPPSKVYPCKYSLFPVLSRFCMFSSIFVKIILIYP